MTRRDGASRKADPTPPVPPARPRISEGVRIDIEVNGWAVDPVTGRKLTRADLPK